MASHDIPALSVREATACNESINDQGWPCGFDPRTHSEANSLEAFQRSTKETKHFQVVWRQMVILLIVSVVLIKADYSYSCMIIAVVYGGLLSASP